MDLLMHQEGLKPAAMKQLVGLVAGVERLAADCPRIRTFGRLVGATEVAAYRPHAADFVVQVRGCPDGVRRRQRVPEGVRRGCKRGSLARPHHSSLGEASHSALSPCGQALHRAN
jgi:hypothetical protein